MSISNNSMSSAIAANNLNELNTLQSIENAEVNSNLEDSKLTGKEDGKFSGAEEKHKHHRHHNHHKLGSKKAPQQRQKAGSKAQTQQKSDADEAEEATSKFLTLTDDEQQGASGSSDKEVDTSAENQLAREESQGRIGEKKEQPKEQTKTRLDAIKEELEKKITDNPELSDEEKQAQLAQQQVAIKHAAMKQYTHERMKSEATGIDAMPMRDILPRLLDKNGKLTGESICAALANLKYPEDAMERLVRKFANVLDAQNGSAVAVRIYMDELKTLSLSKTMFFTAKNMMQERIPALGLRPRPGMREMDLAQSFFAMAGAVSCPVHVMLDQVLGREQWTQMNSTQLRGVYKMLAESIRDDKVLPSSIWRSDDARMKVLDELSTLSGRTFGTAPLKPQVEAQKLESKLRTAFNSWVDKQSQPDASSNVAALPPEVAALTAQVGALLQPAAPLIKPLAVPPPVSHGVANPISAQ